MVDETSTSRRRIVIIGLDGGSFTILDKLFNDGRMPALKSLVERGARGNLRTVIPPVTPSAWSTFMTGKNPGKHGILEFLINNGKGETPVNSTLRHGKTIWRILNEAGMKVVSQSIPTTYPPERVDGFMVSSFLTPIGRKDYGFPNEIMKEIEEKFGAYKLYIREVYAPGRVEKVLRELEDDLEYKFNVAEYLKKRIDWRLFVLHVFGTDRLQHELWHLIDPSHPLHNPKEADKYKERFWKYYERVDDKIKKFVSDLAEEDVVFIISDHGFGPVYKFMNFNVWLLEKGYLRLKRNLWTRFKYLLFKAGVTPKNAYRLAMRLGLARLRLAIGVNSRKSFFNVVDMFLLSLRDVDWSMTTAFSKGYYGQIYINLKGREPEGAVEPEDYEKVREKIIGDLKSITGSATGVKIISEVFRREDIYIGKFVEFAPDLVFLPNDMSYKAIGTTAFTSNRFLEEGYANSADHRMEGILIAGGKAIKKCDVSNAWIGDIAPTVLYLLGLPVPKDMDGKVLCEIIDEEFLKNHPIRYVEISEEDSQSVCDYSEEEKEEIKNRLKGMGYLG